MSKYLKLFFILSMLSIGCQKQYIPNTEIIDTDFHRSVVNFCERYRRAIEDLNVALLINLASPRYYDNAGTPVSDDDIEYSDLQESLEKRFSVIDDLRFEIKYRDIFSQDNKIFVQYTYTMSFQYRIDEKKKWHNYTGDNRLELEPVENSFLITSGM